jgi:hypothetical protein
MYLKKKIDEEDMDRMRISLSVQERKLSPEPHCDFCGEPHPAFIYAASQTTSGEDIQCWRWAACKDCSHLIDTDQTSVIERKIVAWLKKKVELPNVSESVLLFIARESMRTFEDFAVWRL